MSECGTDVGHNFVLGLMDGVPVYGCNRGCGDIQALKDMEKEEIIDLIKEHLEKHNCLEKGFE